MNAPLQQQIDIDKYCHGKGIFFISTSAMGVFGSVFSDFGENFEVTDINGEPARQELISIVSKVIFVKYI